MIALLMVSVSAQVDPSGSTSVDVSKDPVQLSPFEVNSDKDIGYAASTAMSGTRTNEKLENLPNSISVMTQEFIQDSSKTSRSTITSKPSSSR